MAGAKSDSSWPRDQGRRNGMGPGCRALPMMHQKAPRMALGESTRTTVRRSPARRTPSYGAGPAAAPAPRAGVKPPRRAAGSDVRSRLPLHTMVELLEQRRIRTELGRRLGAPRILEDHTPDQQLALVGGTKLHSLLQRDDRRQLLMRGDRRNLLLRQAAQREAILIGYHRSLCGDTASGRLYAPAMIQGNKLRTAYCRQGH